jgi:hypothetical protein
LQVGEYRLEIGHLPTLAYVPMCCHTLERSGVEQAPLLSCELGPLLVPAGEDDGG